ncbi:hypothetical protein V2I01_42635 [Micromonospora sp. BRA006-A]|nr:hypothetical protein [Micromonospora sp. BRA006-A]
MTVDESTTRQRDTPTPAWEAPPERRGPGWFVGDVLLLAGRNIRHMQRRPRPAHGGDPAADDVLHPLHLCVRRRHLGAGRRLQSSSCCPASSGRSSSSAASPACAWASRRTSVTA